MKRPEEDSVHPAGRRTRIHHHKLSRSYFSPLHPKSDSHSTRRPIIQFQLPLLFLFLLLLQISCTHATSVFEDYEECRDREKFGLSLSLICDPDHKLQRSTLRALDSLLRDLQSKITCECDNQCTRGDGLTDKYVGLLLVTTTPKIESGNESLNESARRVYEDAKLGDAACSNGLLIIYIKDQQKLATYRGNGRFAQLDEKDMEKLHELATKSPNDKTDDSVALQFLLSNHEDENREGGNGNVQRAESWAPIVGLTVALVIILIILALLLALLLAKICGCCCGRGSQRKNKYYVTPRPGSYKNIEPIYIVTPPMSERSGTLPPSMRHHMIHHPHANMGGPLYHSPYSGSPVPPPPPPPMSSRGPIVTHPASTSMRSRSVTPTSTHRTRIHPQHSTELYPQHSTSTHESIKPDQTPQGHKRDRVGRTSTTASKHSNATYYTASNVVTPDGAPDNDGQGIVAIPYRNPPEAPPHRSILHQQRSLPMGQSMVLHDPNNPALGLPFLDPRRKQETQTREEFIS